MYHIQYTKKGFLQACEQHIKHNRALIKLMKQRGLTKKEVAELLGMSRYRLNKILAGKELAFLDTVNAVDIFCRNPSRPTSKKETP